MIMRAGNVRDARQALRRDDYSGNSFVRFGRFRILTCEGIREVGVDEKAKPFMTHQVATLTKPSDDYPVAMRCFHLRNILEECIIGKERFNHLYPPCSLRTISTPAHIFVSLRLAAQRAVCESPQSGANASCSAGA